MVADRSQFAEWDPVRLTYAFDGEEVELPMRLLVAGRFSTAAPRERRGEPLPVSAATLDVVLRDLAPRLELRVPDRLLDAGGTRDVTVDVGAMADFAPESLTRTTPDLNAVLELMARLRAGEAGAGEDAHRARLLEALGYQPESADRLWREYAIAELGDRLGRQLDEILHHPEFQELEANWRGVELILGSITDDMHCRVDLLDMPREALLDDFRSHGHSDASLLFQTLHAREFGQYGGEPYAAVIGAYAFGPGAEDIELLRRIAGVCAAAHAPFIAAAAPRLFGLNRFEELADATALPELKRSPRLARWRGLAAEETTRYIGLTVPRVLLRRPWGQDGSRVVSGFAYREETSRLHDHGLWGSAAFGFAETLVRSFQRYRVCVDIIGPAGGRVTGLPEVSQTQSHGHDYPVEVLLSERKEAELADLGVMPLVVARAHQSIAFNSAHSIHWTAVDDAATREADPESLGLRLGAQLPYVFLIARVAHYLKVIQRDMIGTMRTGAEMETELHNWLRRYVSDVENPAPAQRARRPLRRASLRVIDEEGGGAFYRMHLDLVPHTRFMSTEFSLSLEGRLGKE